VAAVADHGVTQESLFITASDGLRLHVRAYRPAVFGASTRPAAEGTPPVICLPGLTRTEADFTPLALHLAGDAQQPRPVFAFDYRGRGQSDYDTDWRNYNLAVELGDVLTALTALRITRAIFIGTSRGGLLTMLLAATQPDVIAGAVLNDIGPVIEPAGLLRIKGYIGQMAAPRDYEDGAESLRRLFGAQFPGLYDTDWLEWSKRSWRSTPEGLVSTYDAALANTLQDFAPNQPLADLWPQFDALAKKPVMAVRGALSDLLSVETVAIMRQHKPDIEIVEVADQGHAPLLSDAPMLDRISAFCRQCDELHTL